MKFCHLKGNMGYLLFFDFWMIVIMYQFIYSPIALIEYKDAVVWYNERTARAAEDFVKQVKEKIDKICHSPFHYPEPTSISEKHR